MAGGLLNLVATSAQNTIIFHNPKKTLFKCKYRKTTNFGIQKFRIDQKGTSVLHFNEPTTFNFEMPRYADLLNECFIVLTIPDIYSSLYKKTTTSGGITTSQYNPYEFKWVKELGNTMIQHVEVFSGGAKLIKYSGEYFSQSIHRDYDDSKLKLWREMIGDIDELKNPELAFDNNGSYPNTFYDEDATNPNNITPSILGRKLYIPLKLWFCEKTYTSLPLISMQYNTLEIRVTFRPIKELYTIKNIDGDDNDTRISPNPNNATHQMVNFIHPPDNVDQTVTSNTSQLWVPDIHMVSNYIFLDEAERNTFAKETQEYLIKDVIEHDINNIFTNHIVRFQTNGLVSNFMFRFRRSDVNERNEWMNYTNYKYENKQNNVLKTKSIPGFTSFTGKITTNYPTEDPNINKKNILVKWGLEYDGKVREEEFDSGVVGYMEPYTRTSGSNKDGVYIYSFASNIDSTNYQPYGGADLTKFENIEMKLELLEPPKDPSGLYYDICDDDGAIIGTRKNVYDMYKYRYDMKIFEERYNIISFKNGLAGLIFSR